MLATLSEKSLLLLNIVFGTCKDQICWTVTFQHLLFKVKLCADTSSKTEHMFFFLFNSILMSNLVSANYSMGKPILYPWKMCPLMFLSANCVCLGTTHRSCFCYRPPSVLFSYLFIWRTFNLLLWWITLFTEALFINMLLAQSLSSCLWSIS